MNMNNINYRYFYYSSSSAEEINKIEKAMNPNFQLPWVVANGIKKYYTDIVTNPSKLKHKDAILIAKGDMRRMSFSQIDQ